MESKLEKDRVYNVSVIICAFNAEKYIGEAIESVLKQTYKNYELLIINDASVDSTLSIAEQYSKKDGRIKIINLYKNQGLAKGRKIALSHTKYDWVIYLDADDIFLPNILEEFVDEINKDPELILVSSYAYYIDSENKRKLGIQKIGPVSKEEFYKAFNGKKLIFFPATSLFSKKHALEVGGPRVEGFGKWEDIRVQDYAEDLDLWMRMSDFGSNGLYMRTTPKPLFLYRKYRGSLSARNTRFMNEKMRWIKECLKARRNDRNEPSYEEYIKSLTNLEKFNNRREDIGTFLYKKAADFYIENNYMQMFFYVVIASLFNPKFVYQKFKNYFVK